MTLKRGAYTLAFLAWCAPGLAIADPQSPPATTEPAVFANAAPAPIVLPEPVAAKPAVPAKPTITLQAKADLAQQTLTVTERGRTIGVWKISSGVEDHPTPRGIFQPEWMSKMWYSQTYDLAPMPHAVFFKSGAAIHATQSVGALGRAASHGCVRLAPANAETFYKLVQRHGLAHTRIAVFGTPKFAPPVVARRDAPSVQQRYAAMPWTGPRSATVRTAFGNSGSAFAPSPYRGYYPPVRSYY